MVIRQRAACSDSISYPAHVMWARQETYSTFVIPLQTLALSNNHMMPAALAGLFHLIRSLIMYKPVYAPCAITYPGEWTTPATATQEDYESLFCACCRLKISLAIDELAGIKIFVHTPLRQETAKLLSTCYYSKAANKLAAGGKIALDPLRPAAPRLYPCKTAKQNWRCCWCHIFWNGEKVCPQCEGWIYAISA